MGRERTVSVRGAVGESEAGMWPGHVASTVDCRLGRAKETGGREGLKEPEFI